MYPSVHCSTAYNSLGMEAKDGEAPHSQQKQDREQTVAQIMNSFLPNSDFIEESTENQ